MKCLAMLLFTVLTVFFARASSAQAPSNFIVTKLTDNIYRLTGTYPYSTNMVVSVGKDGILLVDTGSKYTAEELKGLVKTLDSGKVKLIINTHEHIEHNGGNPVFGKDAIIIGHENLRMKLTTGRYIVEEYPEEALPSVMFTDSLTVYFNGEEIRLIAIPGAHSDNDIIVHFTKSGIASMGALCTGMHFPSVEGTGGNAARYADAVQKAIDLLPDSVTLVPGHGRDCTMAEEKEFQDMLVKTIEIVRAGLAKGKDAAILMQEKVLKDWASYEGGFVNSDQWIQYIVNGIQNIKPKKALIEALYPAMAGKDIDAVIALYYKLKKEQPDEYGFGEGPLTNAGYYLLGKGQTRDAIKLFELYVKEYPDSWNAYDCLGEAYMNDGQKDSARKNYEKSLQLNPQNSNGVEMMKKL